MLRASEMSDCRCWGSSAGRGRWTIFDFEPVREITSRASSAMVNSFGLPMFTGPVKSSGVSSIMRTMTSIRSSMYWNGRLCPPSP